MFAWYHPAGGGREGESDQKMIQMEDASEDILHLTASKLEVQLQSKLDLPRIIRRIARGAHLTEGGTGEIP